MKTQTGVNNQGTSENPCSSSISNKTPDTTVGSQDFPPLPSAEELQTNESEVGLNRDLF